MKWRKWRVATPNNNPNPHSLSHLIFDFPPLRYSGVKHAESSLLQVSEIIILSFYITQKISSSQTKCFTSKRQKSNCLTTDSTIWWCDMPWKRAANQIKSNQVKSNRMKWNQIKSDQIKSNQHKISWKTFLKWINNLSSDFFNSLNNFEIKFIRLFLFLILCGSVNRLAAISSLLN